MLFSTVAYVDKSSRSAYMFVFSPVVSSVVCLAFENKKRSLAFVRQTL
jgi:hypothetical protein